MIIILFGVSGSGKTYIGNILAEYFDFHHLDADQLLTKDMTQSISRQNSFTPQMLDEFTKIIIDKLHKLKNTHSKLVISQGLYRNKHRELIAKEFTNHNLKFFNIAAKDEIIKTRIKQRNNHISIDYANKIKQNFEPMENSEIIDNNDLDDKLLIQKLIKLIKF